MVPNNIDSCANCNKQLALKNSTTDDPAVTKCQDWLQKCNIDECESVCSDSFVSNSDVSELTESTTNSALDSGFVFDNSGVVASHKVICENDNTTGVNEAVDLNTIFNRERNNFEKIQIYKSKKVHIGDVTYINGPVYVNQYKPTVKNQTFLSINNNGASEFPLIIRRSWLAQPPAQPRQYLQAPAKYVVIAHTATEEAYTQADNTLIVRLIQTFHIESRKWDDICYNFLISADGTVFEGRGWGVIGATVSTYNRFSLAIAFIGCYIDHLPSPLALKKAQALIEYGVKIGAIAEDYAVLGHCQCTSVESPGKKLFEEIKTWKNWDSSVTVTTPSRLVLDVLAMK